MKYIFIILLFVSNLSANTQNEIYNKITNNGQKIESLKFKFNQKIISNDVKNSNGEIFYKMPSSFRVNYISPNNIEYISDGEFLWILEKDKQQVLKRILNNDENFFGHQIIEFFKFGDGLLDKYEINSFWIEQKFYCFVFFDKIKKDNKVNVYISKKSLLPERIIFERMDMKFDIEILKLEKNIKIVEDIFKFEEDKNFEIIEV